MIHLLRPSAGTVDLASMVDFQARFRIQKDKEFGSIVIVQTRNTPKRAAEIVNGGSLYWIIKNKIQARQSVLDIRTIKDEEGRKACQFCLSPEVVRVMPVQHRAMQGWRYLDAEKAPRDMGVVSLDANDDLPPEDIARELKELSLL